MEKLFLFHVKEDIKKIMTIICHQLDVEVIEIDEKDVCQQMGYIIGLDGYKRQDDQKFEEDLTKEFMFFVGMNEQQIDLILEVFKQSDLPFIPYKSMLTERNVDYLFYQLYANVAHEYKQMVQDIN